MGTTMDQVKACMDEMGFRYHIDDERSVLVSGFVTENYKDEDGEHHLRVVIRLDEGGEYLAFFAPKTYVCRPDHPSARAVFETAGRMQYCRKLISWEYDPRDGEVRASVSLPLEDSQLTTRQFHRCLHGLVSLVDDSYRQFRHALDTGTCLDSDPGLTTDRRSPAPESAGGHPRPRSGNRRRATPTGIGLAE